MGFMRESREHVLMLLQMVEEHPSASAKSQLLHLAGQWLALATVQDMIETWAEETERRTATLH
jgi:hypothetical protein